MYRFGQGFLCRLVLLHLLHFCTLWRPGAGAGGGDTAKADDRPVAEAAPLSLLAEEARPGIVGPTARKIGCALALTPRPRVEPSCR